MNSWFTVRVKYTKQLENGTLKRVTEPYLLAAMTFTDAEARIYEELGSYIRGEFMVVGIARTDLSDIFQYEDVKEAYSRMEESLAGLMIDYQVLSIVSSPILEIFPYRDEEVQSPGKKVLVNEEPEPSSKGVVFSASGSDLDELEEEDAASDSSLEDHFDEDHE
jgi:hypothetical protein